MLMFYREIEPYIPIGEEERISISPKIKGNISAIPEEGAEYTERNDDSLMSWE